MRLLFLVLFIIGCQTVFSQERRLTPIRNDDSANRSRFSEDGEQRQPSKRERPPVEKYKIISIENDTTIVDTSLTIKKFYKYNYLRRDRFDLLPFSNTGQAHNRLLYSFDDKNIRPLFGARARHFNYMEVEDLYYYEVPTPLTELFYKSVFQQGQILDAFFTMNTSPRFNFSVAYKGMRSLGDYQHILTSTGNFRFTANYRTKNDRYKVKMHYAAQDLLNQENGGLTDEALANFRSGSAQFDDRARLSVNFENAENILDGQRFYINHSFDLFGAKDTIADSRLELGHVLNYEEKFYEYRQQSPVDLFGPSFVTGSLTDRVDLEEFNNRILLRYTNPILGQLTVQANHTYYDYGYNTVLIQEQGRIPNRLQGNLIAAGASYSGNYKGFSLEGDAQVNISGDFEGFDINGTAAYDWKGQAVFEAGIHLNSSPANYNHLLYQSSYQNYNWYNKDIYDNVITGTLDFGVRSDRWLNASVAFTTLDNFAFFGIDPATSLVNSFQAGETINYFKIKVNKEIRYGKFALDNTVAYQKVTEGADFLNVPELITRNTLYYTDRWFKNALFVQTGLNFKYFTAYTINGYDPVLAEFYVQNDEQLGAFPLIDLFFNMKVQQTRIFFIAEHVNSLVSANDYFSAPGYPYRDFTIRFGLVWNFFL